ncbi:unnamed protein product [Tenebrio molitor]|nr:unnamed protein product [Tenebrio molitor]
MQRRRNDSVSRSILEWSVAPLYSFVRLLRERTALVATCVSSPVIYRVCERTIPYTECANDDSPVPMRTETPTPVVHFSETVAVRTTQIRRIPSGSRFSEMPGGPSDGF